MDDPQTRMLSEIAVKVGKLETLQETNARAIGDMAAGVNRLVEKLDKSDDIAREADQRARSAHHRIDDMKKSLKWTISTVVGVTALFLTACGILVKVVIG